MRKTKCIFLYRILNLLSLLTFKLPANIRFHYRSVFTLLCELVYMSATDAVYIQQSEYSCEKKTLEFVTFSSHCEMRWSAKFSTRLNMDSLRSPGEFVS